MHNLVKLIKTVVGKKYLHCHSRRIKGCLAQTLHTPPSFVEELGQATAKQKERAEYYGQTGLGPGAC